MNFGPNFDYPPMEVKGWRPYQESGGDQLIRSYVTDLVDEAIMYLHHTSTLEEKTI
jgi:hypothetical protein